MLVRVRVPLRLLNFKKIFIIMEFLMFFGLMIPSLILSVAWEHIHTVTKHIMSVILIAVIIISTTWLTKVQPPDPVYIPAQSIMIDGKEHLFYINLDDELIAVDNKYSVDKIIIEAHFHRKYSVDANIISYEVIEKK